MKIKQTRLNYSNTWSTPDIYLFTGNSTIKQNGALVMGRGAAKQCRDTFKDLDKKIGNSIKENEFKDYGVLFTSIADSQTLGIFQVKKHYADKADLDLIETSTKVLSGVAARAAHLTFHMNFPGIGAGGLTYESVLPIVNKLPDNVILYI